MIWLPYHACLPYSRPCLHAFLYHSCTASFLWFCICKEARKGEANISVFPFLVFQTLPPTFFPCAHGWWVGQACDSQQHGCDWCFFACPLHACTTCLPCPSPFPPQTCKPTLPPLSHACRHATFTCACLPFIFLPLPFPAFSFFAHTACFVASATHRLSPAGLYFTCIWARLLTACLPPHTTTLPLLCPCVPFFVPTPVPSHLFTFFIVLHT